MDIEGLKQALEAATPGPWRVAGPSGFVENSSSDVATICQFWSRYELDYDNWQANARLIVAAVNNLPKLLKVAEERDALQARCAELEAAAKTMLAHLVAAVSVIERSEESGNHPSCAYGSDTMYQMAMKDFHRCMEAGRKALRSVVDGGE